MTNPTLLRAAKMRQLREKQMLKRSGGDGGDGDGDHDNDGDGVSEMVVAPVGAPAPTVDVNANTDAPPATAEGGKAGTPSNGSYRHSKAQRAAAYRAQIKARANANRSPSNRDQSPPSTPSSPSSTSAADLPPTRPASSTPSLASTLQIDSHLNCPSDALSTASNFTTSSEQTAKVSNNNKTKKSPTTTSISNRSQQRSVSAPRAGASGGSRAANLRKIRDQNPTVVPRAVLHSQSSPAVEQEAAEPEVIESPVEESRPQSPVATATRRSISVPKSRLSSSRFGIGAATTTGNTNSSGATTPPPIHVSTGDDNGSPSSPVSDTSATTSKSEHLSVEKGIKLIERIHSPRAVDPPESPGAVDGSHQWSSNSPRTRSRTPSPSPRSRMRGIDSPRTGTRDGRTTSPSPRASSASMAGSPRVGNSPRPGSRSASPRVGAAGASPSPGFERRSSSASRHRGSRDPPPMARPDPSPTTHQSPNGGAWDRAQRTVQAQMNFDASQRSSSPGEAPASIGASTQSAPASVQMNIDVPRRSSSPASSQMKFGASQHSLSPASTSLSAPTQMNVDATQCSSSPASDPASASVRNTASERHTLEPEQSPTSAAGPTLLSPVQVPPPPSPPQAPGYPGDNLVSTPTDPQEEARIQAEREIYQLQARASEMKRKMELQAAILERQEKEMLDNEKHLLNSTIPAAEVQDSANQNQHIVTDMPPMSQDNINQNHHLPADMPPMPQENFNQNHHIPTNMPPMPHFTPRAQDLQQHQHRQQQQQQDWQHGPSPQSRSDHFFPSSPASSSPYSQFPSQPPYNSNVVAPMSYAPASASAPASPNLQGRGQSDTSTLPGPVSSSAPPSPSAFPSHPSYSPQQFPNASPLHPVDISQQQVLGRAPPPPPPLAIDPYQAPVALEQKYREYNLSPQGSLAAFVPGQDPAMQGNFPHQLSPASQYHHQPQHPAQQTYSPVLASGGQPVAHLHYQSHSTHFTYNEQTSGQQQKQIASIPYPVPADPMLQQCGPIHQLKEGGQASYTETSFEASSISHLTQPSLTAPTSQPSPQNRQKGGSPIIATNEPTFSPPSAGMKSNAPTVATDAIVLDEAGFPVLSPLKASQVAISFEAAYPSSSPSAVPMSCPSPVGTNTLMSDIETHFTGLSAGTGAVASTLGERLASNLNIDSDDDEDVFDGIEDNDGGMKTKAPPAIPEDDIFDGVDNNNGGATARNLYSNALVPASSTPYVSTVLVSVPEEGASIQTPANASRSMISGQNPPPSLNLEYSISTTDKVTSPRDYETEVGVASPKNAMILANGKDAAIIQQSAEKEALVFKEEKKQFIMEMGDKGIVEFPNRDDMADDSGTMTSELTSSIVDTGPNARREAYHAFAHNGPSSKYQPTIKSPIAEVDEVKSKASFRSSKSRSSKNSRASKHSKHSKHTSRSLTERKSPSSNAVNKVEDTRSSGGDTFDEVNEILNNPRSGRKTPKSGRNNSSRSSRKRYESDSSYSEDASTNSGRLDFFSRYGCAVLDSFAMHCGGNSMLRRPQNIDEHSLEDLYDEEETLENNTIGDSTLNETLATNNELLRGDAGLSAQEQKVWNAWDKKNTEALFDGSSQSQSLGTASRIEELGVRQRRAQHQERRARAHEKLLLHAYSAMSLPPPPPGAEKGEDEQSESITPTSNTSSNAENNEPDDRPVSRRRSFVNLDNGNGRSVSASYSPGGPKPPSAPTGSKMLAAKSAIMQRKTLGMFCSRLKNDGLEVLKMNRGKTWQDRVLTVSKEVTPLSEDNDSVFSGERGYYPKGLLWAKKFNRKTKEHSVSEIDKTGKGGILLSHLHGASLGNAVDYPLSKKQLQGEFKDSVVVIIHAAEADNVRDVVIRCKTMEDATFLLSGCRSISETIAKDALAKKANRMNSPRFSVGSEDTSVLSPSSRKSNDANWARM